LSTESFARIEEQKVPYILLDRRFAGLDANFVGGNDEAIGVLATNHLIEQGCQRIAHIRGPEISTAAGRVEGFHKALAPYPSLAQASCVVSIGTSGDHRGESGGFITTKELLSKADRPDGIFCFNDPVALGAMRAILDSGLRIPEDVAVIGCGNLPYSDFLRVPLSSIDQNHQLIGKRAATLALALAQTKTKVPPKSQIVRPQLIVRASSQRIPPA
jgi:LacI family transcriptional regulator